MRKTKKLVTTLLIPSVIASTILSGCGGNNSQNPTTTAPAPTTTASGGSSDNQTTTVADASNAPWELLDSLNKKEGDALTTPRSNYLTYPVDSSEATQTLRYWMELPGNVSKNSASCNDTEWARLWQEATGIKIEFIHPTQGSAQEEFGVLIASGTLPDVIEWE